MRGTAPLGVLAGIGLLLAPGAAGSGALNTTCDAAPTVFVTLPPTTVTVPTATWETINSIVSTITVPQASPPAYGPEPSLPASEETESVTVVFKTRPPVTITETLKSISPTGTTVVVMTAPPRTITRTLKSVPGHDEETVSGALVEPPEETDPPKRARPSTVITATFTLPAESASPDPAFGTVVTATFTLPLPEDTDSAGIPVTAAPTSSLPGLSPVPRDNTTTPPVVTSWLDLESVSVLTSTIPLNSGSGFTESKVTIFMAPSISDMPEPTEGGDFTVSIGENTFSFITPMPSAPSATSLTAIPSVVETDPVWETLSTSTGEVTRPWPSVITFTPIPPEQETTQLGVPESTVPSTTESTSAASEPVSFPSPYSTSELSTMVDGTVLVPPPSRTPVTITYTIPGEPSRSSRVVTFTTELPVVEKTILPPPASPSSVSHIIVTYTLPGGYGYGYPSSVVTFTTESSVSSKPASSSVNPSTSSSSSKRSTKSVSTPATITVTFGPWPSPVNCTTDESLSTSKVLSSGLATAVTTSSSSRGSSAASVLSTGVQTTSSSGRSSTPVTTPPFTNTTSSTSVPVTSSSRSTQTDEVSSVPESSAVETTVSAPLPSANVTSSSSTFNGSASTSMVSQNTTGVIFTSAVNTPIRPTRRPTTSEAATIAANLTTVLPLPSANTTVASVPSSSVEIISSTASSTAVRPGQGGSFNSTTTGVQTVVSPSLNGTSAPLVTPIETSVSSAPSSNGTSSSEVATDTPSSRQQTQGDPASTSAPPVSTIASVAPAQSQNGTIPTATSNASTIAETSTFSAVPTTSSVRIQGQGGTGPSTSIAANVTNDPGSVTRSQVDGAPTPALNSTISSPTPVVNSSTTALPPPAQTGGDQPGFPSNETSAAAASPPVSSGLPNGTTTGQPPRPTQGGIGPSTIVANTTLAGVSAPPQSVQTGTETSSVPDNGTSSVPPRQTQGGVGPSSIATINATSIVADPTISTGNITLPTTSVETTSQPRPTQDGFGPSSISANTTNSLADPTNSNGFNVTSTAASDGTIVQPRPTQDGAGASSGAANTTTASIPQPTSISSGGNFSSTVSGNGTTTSTAARTPQSEGGSSPSTTATWPPMTSGVTNGTSSNTTIGNITTASTATASSEVSLTTAAPQSQGGGGGDVQPSSTAIRGTAGNDTISAQSSTSSVSSTDDGDGSSASTTRRPDQGSVTTTLATVTSGSGNTTSVNFPIATVAPATPCGNPGDRGNVTINFDDRPSLQASNMTSPMPLFVPYHRLWFSEGFSIVPPPNQTHNPSSGGNMTMYVPPNSSDASVGQIGFGPLRTKPCFRFNLLSFDMGCNTTTEDYCQFNITGLRYDAALDREVEVTQFPLSFPSCRVNNFTNCSLSTINLGRSQYNLTDLSSVKFDNIGDESGVWFGDDLVFAWTNNSCDAATCRSEIPDRVMRQQRSLARQLRRVSPRPALASTPKSSMSFLQRIRATARID